MHFCCAAAVAMTTDSLPRMQYHQTKKPLSSSVPRPQERSAESVGQPLSKKKMYTSCESINIDAYNGPPPTSHMMKRKLYMSCEALNSKNDMYPYESPESYFQRSGVDSGERTNNNNTIKGYISHHQHHQQRQQQQQQQQRRATNPAINFNSNIHHHKTNSHPLTNTQKQEYQGYTTPKRRPQLRTFVSIDVDGDGNRDTFLRQDAKIFNSSSVPCLLDYPEEEPVHADDRAGGTVRSVHAPRGKSRTYALSGVPPWKFTHSPPVPNQVITILL